MYGFMDAGGDHGSAAKGSAIDLEVAGWLWAIGCCFSFPPLFLIAMCSSLACLSLRPCRQANVPEFE